MRRYLIVFEESAQKDVRKFYDWGWLVWGQKEGKKIDSQVAGSGLKTT